MNRHDHQVGCPSCAFLPPYIVSRLADNDDPEVRKLGIHTLEASAVARTHREMNPAQLLGRLSAPGRGRRRSVYDMEGRTRPLPGSIKRREGARPTGIEDVDRAYDYAGVTYGFYKNVFDRESLDGAGHGLKSSINFGFEVGNAFWDGNQMIYGAGDGKLFLSFTRSLGIAAHEMTHGVLSFTSKLEYDGEPGALNESFCDVMGICVEHYHAGVDVNEGGWIMGREVVGPALKGVAGFRTFKDELAYDGSPLIGTDPQPKHMKGFVTNADDNGGVHTNSGIPNHAFYLAAIELGGNSWDKAGAIWFEAFTKDLNPKASFVQAATATVNAAQRLYGAGEANAVRESWRKVGVEPEV